MRFFFDVKVNFKQFVLIIVCKNIMNVCYLSLRGVVRTYIYIQYTLINKYKYNIKYYVGQNISVNTFYITDVRSLLLSNHKHGTTNK
jgi:hypothetical protein